MNRTIALWSALGLTCLSLATAWAELPAGPGDWPQWRGPQRNGISRETNLLRAWPEGGPKVLWQVDTVGVGYASMSIKDGRLYTQGDLDGVEHIICIDIRDGSTLWAVQPEPVKLALEERVASEFKRLDKDENGLLDEVEALTGFGPQFNQFDRAEEGGDVKAVATARVERLFKALDANGDGRLTYAEAGNRLQRVWGRIDQADRSADPAQLAQQRAESLFAMADKDQDGKLSRDEARGTVIDEPFNRADDKDRETGRGDNVLTRTEVENYFRGSEAGRDGIIDRAEMLAYVEQTYPGKDGQLTVSELRGYLGGYRNDYGDGPRGTPTVDGDVLYAEGGNGDLTCLDARTGKTLWHLNLAKDLGGGRPGWGYSESPLIVDNVLIVTPGGAKGTVAALDKRTGAVLWRSVDVTEGAHYASPMLAEMGGVPQVVIFGSRNLFGVRLDQGGLLWTYNKANNGTANCSSPLIQGDYAYASSGYGTGGGLVKISNADGKQQADEVYFDKKLQSHHGGVVLVDGHLYGFGSNGLICQNFLTGDLAWQGRSVGKGSVTYADGMIYCLGERHEVALVEASPGEFRETGRFKIDSFPRSSWAHPVVAGGRLYIRNAHRLTAYDISAH